MSTLTQKIKLIAADGMIRKKILFVILGLITFRLLATIPVPGVDPLKLAAFFRDNQLFGLLNVFSGSGLSSLSVVMLGVGPYITASIIMQLLTMMSVKLKALYSEEGDAGRVRFAQYTRRLSVPLCMVQAYGFLILFSRQGLIGSLSTLDLITNIFVITAGSVLLMWLGELMSEYGIGNGTSMIIFAGIVAGLPRHFSQLKLIVETDPSKLPMYILFAAIGILAIWAVVLITEAERPVPVTYAKQVRGNRVVGGVSTYLPLRVNQAGVMPIIFALSFLLLPQVFFNVLKEISTSGIIATISTTITNILNNELIYGIGYFLLVLIFTYFYTAVTFDPTTIATNLQKGGAFIPGVRPGDPTAMYLGRIVTRITLVGAIFLALIAVLPLVLKAYTGNAALTIGGTSLLIAVSVIIDLVKRLEGQVAMREY